MTRRACWRAAVALAVLLAGCGGGSTGPSTGGLTVTVTGLPTGTSAAVTVTGPGGFNRVVQATQTLASLTPGSYTVTAGSVSAGSTVYLGTPPSQNVVVEEGGTPSNATVAYAVTTAGLTVTITGLPDGAAAAVQVTGPDGFDESLTATAAFAGVPSGTYTVTAAAVSHGGTQFTPQAGVQQVVVSAGGGTNATVTYAEDGAAGLNYRVDGVYITQSVQRYAGTVPLVADRDAYLRVFVTATEPGSISPAVRVRFFHSGVQVAEQTLVRAGTTPLVPQEGVLSSSWNLAVSGTLVQPNLSLRVDVDPQNLVAETNETDNQFPATAEPFAMDVRTAGQFQVTLVPVITSVDGRLGGVTAGNKDQFLTATMAMHPLSSFNTLVGGSLTVGNNVAALEPDNGNGSWNTILSQLQTRRTQEGGTRYYLGVVNPSYSSGVAGIGYMAWPVALAWDKLPSAAAIAAHEWGHNWNRQHAPCGDAPNPDASYPYAGGVIGVYGFDVAGATLKPATSSDLMGYCGDEWISDYTYEAVLSYRAAETGVAGSLGTAVQPVMMVSGRVENGQVVLEPAYQTVTRPSLPTREGPYRLEARAADGSRIFGLRFAPVEVADDRRGEKHFTFAVPLAPERASRVASLRLEGEGRAAELRAGAGEPGPVEVLSGPGGRVRLAWDATRAPLVVVRDPRTGEVLAFARGGRAEVVTDAAELALSVSDRLRSRAERIRVPGR